MELAGCIAPGNPGPNKLQSLDKPKFFRSEAEGFVSQINLRKVRGTIIRQKPALVFVVNALEREYRRFLVMCCMYPDLSFVPLPLVDETFWHTHISFTEDYDRDCRCSLLRFVHHAPADISDPVVMVLQAKKFAFTATAYQEIFGEPLVKDNVHGLTSGEAVSESVFSQLRRRIYYFLNPSKDPQRAGNACSAE